MKHQKTFYLTGMMLILMFSSSCGMSDSLSATPLREMTVTPVFDVLPTRSTMDVIDTTAPTAFHTLKPTLTPALTHTTTITPTPVTIPSLSVENARFRLMDLLADNGGCRLPCLWGITPGESTYEEALATLSPLSSISSLTVFKPEHGTITPRYVMEGGLSIDLFIPFLIHNDVITHIVFEGRALKKLAGEGGVEMVFDEIFFGERLNQYMLSKILAEHGRPSSILLSTLGESPPEERGGDIGYFNIVLLYPDQGILAHYTTNMHFVDENVVGCPANAHVELELYPSGSEDAFYELLAKTYWPEAIENNYKSIDTVTNLSLEDFYQTFSQSTDICIETPSELWPVMER